MGVLRIVTKTSTLAALLVGGAMLVQVCLTGGYAATLPIVAASLLLVAFVGWIAQRALRRDRCEEPASAESPAPDAANVRHVITLVHGTWAPNAPWIQPDSTLSRALNERFSTAARIFPFNWSGGNSHKARRRGSECLRMTLEQRLRHYDKAHHYVIAHSHGGNVALYALERPDLWGAMAGVVCLATPFFAARERDLGKRPEVIIAGSIAVVLIVITLMVQNVLLPDAWPPLLEIGISALLLTVVVLPLLIGLRKWRGLVRRLRQELTTPAAEPAKMRIYRSPADEVSGALILVQVISQLTVRLFLAAESWHARIRKLAERWATRRWALVGVAAVALIAMFGFLIGYAKLSDGILPACLTIAALVGFVVSLLVLFEAVMLIVPFLGVDAATLVARLAVSALVWPVVLVLSLTLLLFGWEVAVANILLDVSAEPVPPGTWEVHLKEPPIRAAAPAGTDEGDGPVPLMHSIVYENPAVIEDICDWIAEGGGMLQKAHEVT